MRHPDPKIILAALALLAGSARAEPMPRKKILEAAERFASLQWTLANAGCSLACPCPPSWESDFEPGEQLGMPYKWGGYDDEPTFRNSLGKGLGAGSHQSDGVLTCTTGQDCSGFISLVWGTVKKHSTSTLEEIAKPIRFTDLLPGDALNKKGSHVLLYAGRRNDGVPIFYEASGAAGKVVLNTSASWAYLSGYQPMRYLHVAEGPVVCEGTKDRPIAISAFPYQEQRTMFLACSDVLRKYSCKPTADESGREYIYKFTVDRRGKFQAKVTDSEFVDVDLQVLTAVDENACLARGDADVSVVLDPGTYFLVADTFTDRDRVERSGPYSLSASFAVGAAVTVRDAGKVETVLDAAITSRDFVDTTAKEAPKESGCGCQDMRGGGAAVSLVLFASSVAFLGSRRRR